MVQYNLRKSSSLGGVAKKDPLKSFCFLFKARHDCSYTDVPLADGIHQMAMQCQGALEVFPKLDGNAMRETMASADPAINVRELCGLFGDMPLIPSP